MYGCVCDVRRVRVECLDDNNEVERIGEDLRNPRQCAFVDLLVRGSLKNMERKATDTRSRGSLQIGEKLGQVLFGVV